MTDDPSSPRPVPGAGEPHPSASTASPVLVGVDGSPPSLYALDLAADEAELWSRPLRVVYACRSDGGWAAPTGPVPPEHADPDAVLAQIRHRLGPRPFTYEAVDCDPVTVLVAESVGAHLTVVGHRGGGGYAGLAAGSVSQQLITRCQGPVMVARGATVGAGAPVVVGVDAGAPATGAGPVAFALAEAAMRRVRVEALYAWTPVPAGVVSTGPGGLATGGPATAGGDETSAVRRATEALASALEGVVPSHADVALKSIVEPTTDAAAALVAASHGAGLMVIGPHEGSSLRHLQPGSVGAALLRGSSCPIAVVRRRTTG